MKAGTLFAKYIAIRFQVRDAKAGPVRHGQRSRLATAMPSFGLITSPLSDSGIQG